MLAARRRWTRPAKSWKRAAPSGLCRWLFRPRFTQPDEAGGGEAARSFAGIELLTPVIPVINNIDVKVEHTADGIRDALYRQAFGPVRWVECIRAIKSQGVTTVIECGPGKVLAGMVKRINAEMTGAALFDPATLNEVKGLLS